jgi:hypothetical protein
MDRFKPGEVPPRYEEVNLGSSGGDGARYGAPWWKNKKVWIGVAAVVIIAIVIGVAVGVTQGKKSSYPDYSQLTYTLKDTCEFTFSSLFWLVVHFFFGVYSTHAPLNVHIHLFRNNNYSTLH